MPMKIAVFAGLYNIRALLEMTLEMEVKTEWIFLRIDSVGKHNNNVKCSLE